MHLLEELQHFPKVLPLQVRLAREPQVPSVLMGRPVEDGVEVEEVDVFVEVGLVEVEDLVVEDDDAGGLVEVVLDDASKVQ